MENHWILGSAVVLVVENGGAGWSKLVTPVGVYLPCDSGGIAVGSIPSSVRPSGRRRRRFASWRR